MSISIKMSDSKYWHPGSFVINSYASNGNTNDPTLTGTRSLGNDFRWIDCGGFISTVTYSVTPNWEVPRYATSNNSHATGFSSMPVKFNATFSDTPGVVVCHWGTTSGQTPDEARTKPRAGTISASDVSSTGFKVNGASKAAWADRDWDVGIAWIAVGKLA